jgi:hypothetical protein
MAQRKSTPPGKSASGRGTNASGSTRPGSKAAAAKASAAKAAGETGAGETGTATSKSPSGTSGTTSLNKSASAAKASGAKARPAGKSGSRPGGPKGPAQRPPARKKKKSIVNQKQTPWGLIASAVAVVVFAAAVVVVVVATRKTGTTYAAHTIGGQSVKANDPYRQPELPAAKKIKDLTYTVEAQHTHVVGHIKYDQSPPVGGDHNQYWANCNGTVYTHQLANENAVHMLEHGAVWITYNPKTLPSSQLPTLKKYVNGIDRMALTPYAGLKTPISLQAWGYQLFVNNASDPRIAQFIKLLRDNPKTTPENASCTDPYWDPSKSTFGHPQETAKA